MTGHVAIPRLMLVTDRQRSPRPLPELVAAAIAGGVDAVNLREPDLEPSDMARMATLLARVVAGQAVLLLNNAPSLAAELGLGVHLPERELDSIGVRRQIGPDRLVGRSVHSAKAATTTSAADYLLAGHVFATSSKPLLTPLGSDGLRRIIDAAGAPVLAIGGITADRVPTVLRSGAVGVAVIGAIADAEEPERAAAELRAVIDRELRAIEEGRMGTEPREATEHPEVKIVANGKPLAVPRGTTIDDFLGSRGLSAGMTIVERNGEVVPRTDYGATGLAAGDRLEVVHAVGGG